MIEMVPNQTHFGGGKVSTEAALDDACKALTMIDEYSRTCLTIHCARHISVNEVIEQLANAMIVHGIPKHIRSDNGPEFIATRLRDWLAHVGVKTAYIEPGSP